MLLAGGDSFTWGNELPDCDESRFSRLSWSALLAEQHGMTYNCVAEGGASNQTIARKVMEAVDSSTEMVVVMWTFPVRHELLLRRDHADRLKRSYVNVSPWHALEEKDAALRQYAESLMSIAAHEYHEQQSIAAVYSLYSFLRSRNIEFLFSAASQQVYEMLARTSPLSAELKTASWYRRGEGFYDWAKQQGYKMTELGHPIAEAHRAWLDKYSHED